MSKFYLTIYMYMFWLGYCAEFNILGSVIQDNYYADCTNHDPPCPSVYNSAEAYKCKFEMTDMFLSLKDISYCYDKYLHVSGSLPVITLLIDFEMSTPTHFINGYSRV